MVEQSVDICYVTYTRENTGRGGGGCAGGYAGTGTDVLIDNSIIIIIIILLLLLLPHDCSTSEIVFIAQDYR